MKKQVVPEADDDTEVDLASYAYQIWENAVTADPDYPFILKKHLGDQVPESIASLESVSLLEQKPLALFCSVRCRGELILKTYDFAKTLRDKGIIVISGFHSPH
jgi:hypothetical protein